MEPLAIACISAGVWVTYCGAYGIPPIETLLQIIRDPASSRQTLADAKAATAQRLNELGIALSSTAGTTGGNVATSGNPFSAFSVTRDFADHRQDGSNGIDYGMPVGTPLPSAIAGRVTISPNAGNYGHKATVRANGVVSTYAHLSKFAVKDGQEVKVGDILGYSGGQRGAEGAGNSKGPHLHWEMTVNMAAVDPSKYFSQKAVAA